MDYALLFGVQLVSGSRLDTYRGGLQGRHNSDKGGTRRRKREVGLQSDQDEAILLLLLFDKITQS